MYLEKSIKEINDLLKKGNEIEAPKDIYEHPENYSSNNKEWLQETTEQLNRAKNNPDAEVTIYRATPGDKINEGDWVTLSKKYEAVCTSLEKLITITKNLNNPEIQMSPQSFNELKAEYKSVLKECNNFLKTDEKQISSYEMSRKDIVKDIARVLFKDMKVLETCNPLEPGSLSEIIGKSRSYTISLKGDDIKKVGGALSSRIPLKTASGKKGFLYCLMAKV